MAFAIGAVLFAIRGEEVAMSTTMLIVRSCKFCW